MKKIVLTLCLIALLPSWLFADEGMWLPMLLKKYNIDDMRKKGFHLTADDLYSVNHASLKDAIVQFGGGCTGEVVSNEGLLLTNHHCGYKQIQQHSSMEHNYLEKGFWAKSKSEELPNPGLSVQFLVTMEDVSKRVLDGVTDQMDEKERKTLIDERCKQIAAEAKTEKGYKTSVKPIYYGNQYILYVYEEFTDVRLVGTPPDAIGKFGGDTDNWVWPRHTGDFSMFRIYADKDNKPADYSPENVPYKPKKFLQISLKGYEEGDFTVTYGFPGTTQEYVPSYAIENLTRSNPQKIALRDQRLAIINDAMAKDSSVRIMYAAKQANIANAWKKWQGELKGLSRMKAVQKKQLEEDKFQRWANDTSKTKANYADVLGQLKNTYLEMAEPSLVNDYYNEAILGVELFSLCSRLSKVVEGDKIPTNIAIQADSLAETLTPFYKDYSKPVDKKIFSAMLKSYIKNVSRPYQPDEFKSMLSECGGSVDKLADKIYDETQLVDETFVDALLISRNGSAIRFSVQMDPAYRLFRSFDLMLKEKVSKELKDWRAQADLLQQKYMRGMMEMYPNKKFYPDANSTLRVSYGSVEGFDGADAEHYTHYTTLKGVIEKSKKSAPDYKAPTKLKQLYAKRDFGRYANDKGEQPVAFTASNHTSGGNSGSPVLNADGHLIGINFDRTWESTMSDLMYDPEYSRNISVDIRYVMFIIDKYAGAKNLINEMKIAGENNTPSGVQIKPEMPGLKKKVAHPGTKTAAPKR